MQKFFLFIISFLFIGALCAQPASVDLQNKLFGLQNMSADFQQTVVEADGTVLQKTSGKMALARPNKFSWQTTSGIEQLIITNGERLWIYDPQLKQVTIRSLTASINQTPLLLIMNSSGNLNKNFIIEKIKSTDGKDWFRLKSKNKNDVFTSITVVFSGVEIQQLFFVNQLGQKTNLIFTNIKINQKNIINFNFLIPKDVDVIDELKK